MTEDLLSRIDALERRLTRQRIWTTSLTAACLLLLVTGFARQAPLILRAQGIVIEDAQGRPRMLIGAPVPAVKERLRTDAATGLILLDSAGRDRLALGGYGGPQINGRVVARMSQAVGLVMNDAAGNERGGFALQANGTINLGLDTPDGREIASYFYTPREGAAIYFGSEVGPGGDRALLGVFRDGNTAVFKLADTLNSELLMLKAAGRNHLSVFGRDSSYAFHEVPSPFKH